MASRLASTKAALVVWPSAKALAKLEKVCRMGLIVGEIP
jgi:hypothetical protein